MTLPEMSIAGGAVILAVTAIRALALDRLPKRTFLVLWTVAVLRLLVPVRVPSPVSVYRLFDQARPAAVEIAMAEPAALPETQPAAVPSPPEVPAIGTEPEISIPWLTVLWAAGAAGCAVYFLLGYIAALVRFREAVEVQDPFVDRWRDSYGLRRRVSVRLSGRVKGPAAYGLLRPVILLSADVDWRDRQRMWLILCHEYTHIRRLDGAKKLILAATACLHWFNPLVWLMLLLAGRDMELACDEQVLRAMGSDGRADYARTLIDMAPTRPGASPLVTYFDKSALAERIGAIMKTKKPSAPAAAAGALLVLAVTAVFAGSAPAAKAAVTVPEPSAPAVHRIAYTAPSPSPAPAEPEATARPRPTKNEVLSARKQALAGMAQVDIDRLTSVITYQNQWWENEYLSNILTRLEDAEDLAWNYFDQTGEIEVSYAFGWEYEGDLTPEEIDAQCLAEGLSREEFFTKYGVQRISTVAVENKYSVDQIVSMLEDMRSTVQNEDLRTDLAYLSRQIRLAQRTHSMWHVSQMFKLLHDLDYYLLRYGPEDQPSTRPGEPSAVGVYYGMLTILGADHGLGPDPDWQPASPPPAP